MICVQIDSSFSYQASINSFISSNTTATTPTNPNSNSQTAPQNGSKSQKPKVNSRGDEFSNQNYVPPPQPPNMMQTSTPTGSTCTTTIMSLPLKNQCYYNQKLKQSGTTNNNNQGYMLNADMADFSMRANHFSDFRGDFMHNQSSLGNAKNKFKNFDAFAV